MIDFPSSPTNGQTFISGTTTYIWNSTKTQWQISNALTQGLILSTIGVTTLSGSNTGDQTNISGNAGSATVAGGIKLLSGAVKTVPVAGDSGRFEYDGTRVSIIDSTGARKSIVYSTDTIAAATTAANVSIVNDVATAVAVYPTGAWDFSNTGSVDVAVTAAVGACTTAATATFTN